MEASAMAPTSAARPKAQSPSAACRRHPSEKICKLHPGKYVPRPPLFWSVHDGLSSPLVFAPRGGLARLAAVGSSALVSSRRAAARSRPFLAIAILTRRHQRRADDAMAAGPKPPLTTLPRVFFSHMPRMRSLTHERVLRVRVCKVGAFDRERLLALAAIVEAAPLTRLALVKACCLTPC